MRSIAASEAQQKNRDTIAKARQEAADRLVELLQGDRVRLDAESRRMAARTGPARYLAIQLCTDAETVIRWAGGAFGNADRSVGGGADDRGGAAELTKPESARACEPIQMLRHTRGEAARRGRFPQAKWRPRRSPLAAFHRAEPRRPRIGRL